MKDPIVEEVRGVREAYAARFNYDIRKIYEDAKAREQTGNHPIADLRPIELQPAPPQPVPDNDRLTRP